MRLCKDLLGKAEGSDVAKADCSKDGGNKVEAHNVHADLWGCPGRVVTGGRGRGMLNGSNGRETFLVVWKVRGEGEEEEEEKEEEEEEEEVVVKEGEEREVFETK